MDDLDCDSTWEDDAEDDGDDASAGDDDDGEPGVPGDADAEDEDEAPPSALQSRMLESRNWRAMRDTRRYRHHYPDLVERDSNGDMPNLSFYRNETRFLPNGCFIEDILQNWREDYDLLEDNHSYIQWLFPLREPGVNWHAKPLTKREIEAFRSSKDVGARLLQAYELMLGFYGAQLEDRDSGAVCRAQNYQKRFQNLNCRSHNNLRITRILKSLGELGLERFQAPLVRFFLEETLVHRQLPGVRQSALDYFVFTVRCRRQRRALLRFAWEHFRPRGRFVWAPPGRLQRMRLRPALPAGPGPAHRPAHPPEPQEGGAPQPPSPQERKKRKLGGSRARAPGAQSAAEVEKIALNLEGCALSPGSLGSETQDAGQERGAPEPPGPPPPGPQAAAEVRKRRKVEEGALLAAGDGAQAAAPTGPPAASSCTEAGVEKGAEAEGHGGPEQGAPQSPEHGALRNPEPGAPVIPEQGAPRSPEEDAPGSPEQGAPQNPEEGTPGSPEEGAPQNPEEGAPQNPEQGTPRSPEEGAPRNPEQGTPGSPEEGAPQNPEQGTPRSPEQGTPGSPEQADSASGAGCGPPKALGGGRPAAS